VKRRLFNVLAAVSLVLCLATAALWVRSCWRLDFIVTREWDSSSGNRLFIRFLVLTSSWGGVEFATYRYDEPLAGVGPRPAQPLVAWHSQPDPSLIAGRSPGLMGRLNFYAGVQDRQYGVQREHINRIVLPHWLIVAACAVLPGLWLRRFGRTRHRSAAGRCRTCGYDLRATADRCPECGTTPAKPRERMP
jgi:hypothetical protein